MCVLGEVGSHSSDLPTPARYRNNRGCKGIQKYDNIIFANVFNYVFWETLFYGDFKRNSYTTGQIKFLKSMFLQ